MFGLMKEKICSGTGAERDARRYSYCGTCKTLGARYGHWSRFFLNHDAVFLAELLDALPGRGEAAPIDPAFSSFSCLSLPADSPSVPVRLRYAAAVAVFMAEGKLADRREDSPSRVLEVAARAYAGAFGRAADDLEAWGAPVRAVRELLRSQAGREAAAEAEAGRSPASSILARLAAPTAEATALFFESGARLGGDVRAAAALAALGRAFGTLVYLLDAFEDYDRDATRGEFNAFRAAYALPPGPLPEAHRPALRQTVWSAGVETVNRIQDLPIAADRRERFVHRLRSNLSARLGTGSPRHVCVTTRAGSDGAGRPSAVDRARAIAVLSLASSHPSVRWVLAPVFLVLALPLALFLPAWARPERSLRESLGLLLNLMFAGGIVRVLVSPLRFSAVGPGDPSEAGGEEPDAGEQPKAEGSGGGDGGCDCCDDCDCGDCCSGCDC